MRIVLSRRQEGEQPSWIATDELRTEIAPLPPPRPPCRQQFPGRKPLDDRKVLCGILFVLYTAIPWEYLSQELWFGSRMTCWRRLRGWNDAGVWQRPHEVLLGELRAADLAASFPVGTRVTAQIVEFKDDRETVVLSRKVLLPPSYEQFKLWYAVGAAVQGTVRNMNNSFVYVDLAGGANGIIPISRLAAHGSTTPAVWSPSANGCRLASSPPTTSGGKSNCPSETDCTSDRSERPSVVLARDQAGLALAWPVGADRWPCGDEGTRPSCTFGVRPNVQITRRRQG